MVELSSTTCFPYSSGKLLRSSEFPSDLLQTNKEIKIHLPIQEHNNHDTDKNRGESPFTWLSICLLHEEASEVCNTRREGKKEGEKEDSSM